MILINGQNGRYFLQLPSVGYRAGYVATLLAVLLVGGCASLPSDFSREQTQAMSDTETTRLGRAVAPSAAEHQPRSGFRPLGNGLDALVARLVLAGLAERSLDVQYYLFHDDATGRLLAAHLLKAADRGVRVRLLVDDMDMQRKDAGLAALAQHPMIEIHLFNPFPSRQMRLLNFLTHFGTVTRRMHNKSFTADNQLSIVGGRNIGDEYFAAAEGTNFGDMDVLAIGPIVRDVSASFDRYWNSQQAIPVAVLTERGDTQSLEVARRGLAEHQAMMADSPYTRRLRESTLARQLQKRELDWYWGAAELLVDRPEKVVTDPRDRSTHLGPELRDLIASAQTELFLISPYFVPGKSGTALLSELVSRGVSVTVLTNSLAATDVPAVHGGYARYRHALLGAGVKLYEVQPSAQMDDDEGRRFGRSQASLHAKSVVIDRQQVLVGSMNLDPRSALLNTEMGIVIDSPPFAEAIMAWRDASISALAWRVEQATVQSVYGETETLVWVETRDGQEYRLATREPEAGIWARLQAAIARLLPIEQQL